MVARGVPTQQSRQSPEQHRRRKLERFRNDGPTPTEQADGVSMCWGSLPRQLETNEAQQRVMSEIELYDLGLDYLKRFPGHLSVH